MFHQDQEAAAVWHSSVHNQSQTAAQQMHRSLSCGQQGSLTHARIPSETVDPEVCSI